MMSFTPNRAHDDRTRADDDRALFARYLDKRDPVDREMLVERFLPLARQLARRYQRPEEPFDDLFQVACLGLVKAIDRFDPERGTAFSTFAVPTILGELKRYFRDSGWAAHVPRGMQERTMHLEKAIEALQRRLGRSPSPNRPRRRPRPPSTYSRTRGGRMRRPRAALV